MEFKNFGIIFDIEPSKFIADGAFYVNEDITESFENNLSNINLLSLKMQSLNFDSKINSIISEVSNNENDKTVDERDEEIINFFNDNSGNTLDIIFFGDTGIRGTNKVILEENSIFYIKITENVKLGFFINKTMANLMFKSGDY